MIQQTLCFDGPKECLHPGLPSQFVRVFQLMSDGAWRTLAEIGQETDASEASASARLRDCRKARFGGPDSLHPERPGHVVLKHLRAPGLWEYKLIPDVEWARAAGLWEYSLLRRDDGE